MKAKRAYLTQKEKDAISERQGHVCFMWGCTEPIAIWEHWHTVALGNDEKPDCGLCAGHARIKTYGGPGRVGGDIRDIKHTKKLRDGRTQYEKRKKAGGSRIKGRNTLAKGKLKKTMSGKVVKR